MREVSGHRRSVRHYHDPGDIHELTFSCYDRLPLLTNDHWRGLLSQSIDRALANHDFALVAFVFMPEHVHLLVYPRKTRSDIDKLLYAIKRPFSYRVKQMLQESANPLLKKLTVPDKRKKTVFRFWQKGPGYDRNLQSADTVTASMEYIHNNPVARGLCREAVQWKWSSSRWYASDGCDVDPDLPTIHGLPAEFFDE